MKRMILIGVLVVAMVVGVVAYSYADTASQSVTVTATPNTRLEFTVDANTVEFGDVDLGSTYSDTVGMEVKSNRLWDIELAQADTEWIAAADASDSTAHTASEFLTDSLDDPVNSSSDDTVSGLNRGVKNFTATYELDLTSDMAWELNGETEYSDTFTYTITQQ